MTRGDALLWARTAGFRRNVDQARGIVERALAAAPSWYVAFSAGKDSTCVLSLVRLAAPETRANFSARQWDLPETKALIARTPNVDQVAYAGWDGTEWLPSWDEAPPAAVNWLESKEAIARRGSIEAGVFLGLRADENAYRKVHLARFGPLFQMRGAGDWHCNPIAHWSVLDVWGYIWGNGLDYNRAYDVMDRIGVPLNRQRIGPFGRALNAGALAILKRGWPEEFNRLAARHPEARAYA